MKAAGDMCARVGAVARMLWQLWRIPADAPRQEKNAAFGALALAVQAALKPRDVVVLMLDRTTLRAAGDLERLALAQAILVVLRRDVFPEMRFVLAVPQADGFASAGETGTGEAN